MCNHSTVWLISHNNEQIVIVNTCYTLIPFSSSFLFTMIMIEVNEDIIKISRRSFIYTLNKTEFTTQVITEIMYKTEEIFVIHPKINCWRQKRMSQLVIDNSSYTSRSQYCEASIFQPLFQ